ncbi:MAG: phosphoheptose isomerase, partial [Sphingomicrobium sp.]
MKLDRRFVEKPWGRIELPRMFHAPAGRRIGEVWFTGRGELPLLAKYIFTSERLSIQVHPNDQEARERGLGQGKSECWY